VTALSTNSRSPRVAHGSVYVAVLVASTIVSVIGLSSLTAVRSQQRASQNLADFVEAKFYAQSAIDMAMFQMRADSRWRVNYPNGDWWTDQPIGAGTYSVNVIDPLDGVLQGDDLHRVTVTGSGRKARATYILAVDVLEAGNPATLSRAHGGGLSCPEQPGNVRVSRRPCGIPNLPRNRGRREFSHIRIHRSPRP